MRNEKTHAPTGIDLRRRVRTLTVGVTGAAVLATAGATATMAYEQNAHHTDAVAAGSVAGDVAGSSATSSPAGSSSSPDAAALAGPIQAPTGTDNTGGSNSITGHAGSGGS